MNTALVKEALEQFDFRGLFVDELGWDRHYEIYSIDVHPSQSRVERRLKKSGDLAIQRSHKTYQLETVAQKRGVVIFVCHTSEQTTTADYDTRRKIEARANRIAREHLVIFADKACCTQTWLWAKRINRQSPKYRERVIKQESDYSDFLSQLTPIAFSMEEEDSLTLVRVVERMHKAFDVEPPAKERKPSPWWAVNCTGLNFEQAVAAVNENFCLPLDSAHGFARPGSYSRWKGSERDAWDFHCQNCRASINERIGLCWYCQQHTLRFNSLGGTQTLTGFALQGWECSECGKSFFTSERDAVKLIVLDREFLHCPWCEHQSFEGYENVGGGGSVRTEGWWDGFRPYYEAQFSYKADLLSADFRDGSSIRFPVPSLSEQMYPFHPGICHSWDVGTGDFHCPCCGEVGNIEFALCENCWSALFHGQHNAPHISFPIVRVWNCQECTRFTFTPIWEPNLPVLAWWLEGREYLFCPWCREEVGRFFPDERGTSYCMQINDIHSPTLPRHNDAKSKK